MASFPTAVAKTPSITRQCSPATYPRPMAAAKRVGTVGEKMRAGLTVTLATLGMRAIRWGGHESNMCETRNQ
jgi:hypothetical protein